MKISILASDLGHNCMGRAYILARVLQRKYDVEVLGPLFNGAIWYPIRDEGTISYKQIGFDGRFRSYSKLGRSLKDISGDIIYACKPLMTSFGLALLKKMMSKKPLILDIDDWELGILKEFYSELPVSKKIRNLISSFHDYSSYWNICFIEQLIPLADEITVSNSFLRNRFKGAIVPHGRDTDLLNPELYDRDSLREKIGIRHGKVVAFIGTPRLHKGIGDLIAAVGLLKDKDVALLMVGLTDKHEDIRRLAEGAIGSERVLFFGEQPVGRIAEFLAVSDIVVAPQKDNLATKGQTPAKIFDAMSMAKPVIASSVNDIPEILEGCGMVVEPGNVRDIADKISILLDNKDLADELGRNARKKCVEKYSWDAMEKILSGVFERYT